MKLDVQVGQIACGGLTTSKLAADLGLKADSIRKRFCQTGSYFGIRPIKLPNGRLRWPADAVRRLQEGGSK